MNDISLRKLRYFLALAEELHFGKAALACSISQPALSMQIKELEESLNARLIERDTKNVRLTALGDEFAQKAQEILKSVDDLHNLVRAAPNIFQGSLTLGAIPTIAPYYLPKIINRLQTKYKKIHITPHEAITDKLVQGLLDRKLDAAIVALPMEEHSLFAYPLFEEEFILVRPLNKEKDPIPTMPELLNERLLLLEDGHCLRDQALSFCGIKKISSRHKMIIEGNSLSTLVQMVGAGVGMTVIPKMAVSIETASVKVALAQLQSPRPSRLVGMVWRKSSPLFQHLHEMAGFLKNR